MPDYQKKSENTKRKKVVDWDPKKTVMTDFKKADDIPWSPERTVMKTLKESVGSKKKKDSEP